MAAEHQCAGFVHVAALVVLMVSNMNPKERLGHDFLIGLRGRQLYPTDFLGAILDVDGFEG